MKHKDVQLFVPKFRVEECLAEIRECLEKGWTGLGYKTIEFEKAWDKYTGMKGSHFVNSATAGLHLAVRILGRRHFWPQDAEIITTPITFVSTNHAIVYEGFTPVFVDVDQYLCLDPYKIEEAITDKTRAVMFVGLGGSSGQLNQVVQICQDNNLKLILDAAHMAGTRIEGQHVGPEADAAVFSFQAVKNLPTADSGMIWFNDPGLRKWVRELSWLGINKDTYSRSRDSGAYKWKYNVDNIGYKYHGNSIMAALGIVGLKYLDADNAYRRQLASWYAHRMIHIPNVKCVPSSPYCESSRHLFQIMSENRDELMVHLNSSGVYPGVHYQSNLDYPMYIGCNRAPCFNASRADREIISLPMHMSMTHADVMRVCDLIQGFYNDQA